MSALFNVTTKGIFVNSNCLSFSGNAKILMMLRVYYRISLVISFHSVTFIKGLFFLEIVSLEAKWQNTMKQLGHQSIRKYVKWNTRTWAATIIAKSDHHEKFSTILTLTQGDTFLAVMTLVVCTGCPHSLLLVLVAKLQHPRRWHKLVATSEVYCPL